MKRLWRPANDDVPTQAWLEFKSEPCFYDCVSHCPSLVWKVKHYYSGRKTSDRERGAANFIWFARFETSFNEQDCKRID